MKIQFIWPNFDCPVGISIGVSYLSGALKAAGHDTRILHLSDRLGYPFDPDRITSDVRAYGPDLIGISVATNFYPAMQQLGRQLKQALDVPIVFGGIHTTLDTAGVMRQNPWLDFANIGEGDDSLPELVHALENGRDTTTIANVWTRDASGGVVRNPARRLKDLTRLPWMDLEGWAFEQVTEQKRGWANVMMNRGCPYRCSYCHNNGVVKILQADFCSASSSNEALGYLRYRGIDDMLAELCSIRLRYPSVRSFCFCDDTFTMDQGQMKQFLRRYRDEVDLPFVCMTTVLDVDREMLELMKQAGCDQVRFGVESASPRLRKTVIRRNFPNRTIEQVFDTCREIGLRTFAYSMLANPTETREEMLATLRLNARIRPTGIRPSLGQPYPGTEYYDIAESLGAIDHRVKVHNYLTDTVLKWSDQDRLWIDKLRSFYWWWLNLFLDNGASAQYGRMIVNLEGLSAGEWGRLETRRQLAELDHQFSRMLQRQQVDHYHTPFTDRHDIAFLHQAGQPGQDDIPHR